MTVRPINTNPDGSIDVVFDETGHTGTIPATEIKWTTDPMGTGENHNFIMLNCPDGCGGSTTHPVGGGAAPPDIQQLFVDKIARDGCACPDVPNARSDNVPFAHARLLCNRMDGAGRWQIDPPTVVAAQLASPDTVEVVYRVTDSMILGMFPGGAVDSDCLVAAVPQSEYDNLMRYDPAYLSADSEHIQADPPGRQAAA
jgi:hypothetical protein